MSGIKPFVDPVLSGAHQSQTTSTGTSLNAFTAAETSNPPANSPPTASGLARMLLPANITAALPTGGPSNIIIAEKDETSQVLLAAIARAPLNKEEDFADHPSISNLLKLCQKAPPLEMFNAPHITIQQLISMYNQPVIRDTQSLFAQFTDAQL
ncbi:hypothetical protein Pelo_13229 [Pelomyxa schiedti]|nr:hypothetical protein Pelo_13229 [Pelomyxa schiedti]